MIIDDLDRCAAPKAAELLDSLQLLISGNGEEEEDFPVIFLLGLDREKVAAGVAVKYESMLPYVGQGLSNCHRERLESGREFGYEYLQKFIDIPFRIPMLTERNMTPFINYLAGLDNPSPPTNNGSQRTSTNKNANESKETDILINTYKDNKTTPLIPADIEEKRIKTQESVEKQFNHIDLSATLWMTAPLLGNNPRRMKQYRNLLTIRTYLGEKTGLFDKGITMEMLAKVVVLELARPTLYRKMCENADFAQSISQMILEEDEAINLENSDTQWLKSHSSTLRADLTEREEASSFPTDQNLALILSLSAPPSETEAEVSEEMSS